MKISIIKEQVKEFVFGTKAKGEPAYPKITFYTTHPNKPLQYNDWTDKYKVSSRIPK